MSRYFIFSTREDQYFNQEPLLYKAETTKFWKNGIEIIPAGF